MTKSAHPEKPELVIKQQKTPETVAQSQVCASPPAGFALMPRQWTSTMAHAGYEVHKHADVQCAECGEIWIAMWEQYQREGLAACEASAGAVPSDKPESESGSRA